MTYTSHGKSVFSSLDFIQIASYLSGIFYFPHPFPVGFIDAPDSYIARA